MTTSGTTHRAGPLPLLIALVAVLTATNIARSSVVPHGAHFFLNVALAAGVVAAAHFMGGLDAAALGVSRRSLGAGLRYGAGAFGLVVVVAAVAAALPAGRHALDVDDAHVTAGSLALRVGLIIPVGTVIVEELIFRGVLHGLLTRAFSPLRAWMIGAMLFGAWHVYPAWRADGAAAAMGTFVATTIAGVIFVWLRVRSDHVVAPMLAHLATNTVPLTTAWLLAH
ncbi:MAG: CPBP family intramembrane metalloprotease [Actinobacteria bacterium]|nr:CPBP family intramembrane metalloprotease [Actinomycetota bacterium]